MSLYRALQTTNITVKGRHIEAKAGETYEFTDEEFERIPNGYFTQANESILAGESSMEERYPSRKKEKGGRF